MNIVLNDAELTVEIAAANGSMREVISRAKQLARRFFKVPTLSKPMLF